MTWMLPALQLPAWAFAVHPEEPPREIQLGTRAPAAGQWAGPYYEAMEDHLQGHPSQSRDLRRQLRPTDPTCFARVKSSALTFGLSTFSSGGCRVLCLIGGRQQHEPEVLPRGLRGLHHRHAAAFVCMSSHTPKERSCMKTLHHFVCQIWDGTAGWSILRASPWSPVPSATGKTRLSSVHHPSPAAGTPTHRSDF